MVGSRKPEINSILKNFDRFLRTDFSENRTINEWKEFFSSQFAFIFQTRKYNIDFQKLYRARFNLSANNKSSLLFKHAKELWAPPRKYVRHQGRCNLKNQSMLYLSTYPTTTIFEIKPPTNSDITILEYDSLGEIGPIGIIGVNYVMRAREDYYKIFKDHFHGNTDESRLLDDIISEMFRMKSDNELNYNVYNLTNAITQIFLNNQKVKNVPKRHIEPKSVGLIYPSVETETIKGINVVFNAHAIKRCLKPNKGFVFRIIKREDEHHYIIKLTHVTKKIFENGEMQWKKIFEHEIETISDLNY